MVRRSRGVDVGRLPGLDSTDSERNGLGGGSSDSLSAPDAPTRCEPPAARCLLRSGFPCDLTCVWEHASARSFESLESVETPCVQEGASPEFIHRIIPLSDRQANHRNVDSTVMVKSAAELAEW